MTRIFYDQKIEFTMISDVQDGDTYINCSFKHVIFDDPSTDKSVTFKSCLLDDVIYPAGLTFGPDAIRMDGMKRI